VQSTYIELFLIVRAVSPVVFPTSIPTAGLEAGADDSPVGSRSPAI